MRTGSLVGTDGFGVGPNDSELSAHVRGERAADLAPFRYQDPMAFFKAQQMATVADRKMALPLTRRTSVAAWRIEIGKLTRIAKKPKSIFLRGPTVQTMTPRT